MGGVGCVGSRRRSAVVSPSCPRRAVSPGVRPAPRATRPPPPHTPLRCLPSPPRVRGPSPLPGHHRSRPHPSGRAARARGRVRVRIRAPGTRAPAATRGTPRRLPAAARSPPGLWPCRGSRPRAPRCARAWPVAAVGAGRGRGGARCVCRPCWASASVRAPTPRHPPSPVHLSGAPPPRPSRDRRLVLPPRPASVPPSARLPARRPLLPPPSDSPLY